MVEPGLTSRLRQHSRRSGVLVGVSMALTIAICIVAFIWIYVRVGPFLSDFIPRQAKPAPTPTVQLGGSGPAGAATPTKG
ncbi:MAG: hypothetical protein IRY97_08745, partial [Thermomicrobiaceae bacterium]|nr:hypothetical protein [Thermomicrobiaceae bacterium]